MKQKTSIQTLLEQIVLKQVQGSVYLVPAITDIQIKEIVDLHRKEIEDSYKKGCSIGFNDCRNGTLLISKLSDEYYNETFEQ